MTRINISESLTLLVTDKSKNSGIKYAARAYLHAVAVLCIFILVAALSCSAQNSMVGDGFGGRLWYNPTNYTVGSYSAYSICSSEDCSGTNQLYGWGGNSFGNLGFPNTTIGFNVPTAIPNMTDVKYYSCGYSMAAIKNDNTGWAWGTYMPSVTPAQVINDVKFTDGGIGYCSFVKNDGTVWSIGSSYSGEFGNGQAYQSITVPVQMQGISNAVRVACGISTTYVLLEDGTVRSTGSNSSGLLGIGSNEYNSTTPVVVPGLNNIIDIKANTYLTLALSANGEVYAWGLFPDYTVNNIPVQIASLANIVAISACADGYHIFALDEAKNCYVWGGTYYPPATGLPIGSGIDPTIVATDVIDIMAGETFSYIVKSDGTLWAAGFSNGGSIWLNLPNETSIGPELYDGFVQLDPSLVPEACSVVSQIASSAYSCETAGSVEIIVTGGQAPYQYNIGNGNQTENVFTGLSPGEYAITITNAVGCETVLNAVVDDGGMNYPVPALGPNLQLCQGATMALDAGNAGANYLWSTGQTTQTIEVTDSGIYSVEVTMNGCTNEDELQVNFQELPVANLGNDFAECEGTIASLMAPSYTGATYLWSTGQTTQTIEASNNGIYSVEINWNGCTAEDEVQIEFLPLPIVNLGDDITQCEGAGINLTTTNYEGASYSWSNGQTSQSIIANESGTYSVEIDWNGCNAEDEIEIEILPLPVVNLGDEITECEGTNINLTTTEYEGASYSWSTGQSSQSIVVAQSGIYSVVIDWNGCTSEDEVQIEFLPLPLVNLGDDITQCEGAGINLTTTNYEGASYSWSNGQTTQSIIANESGTYSVEIDWNGCNAEDEIEIEILPLPVVNLGDEITQCEGTNINLTTPEYEGASYSWSTGQSSQTIEASNSGIYSVEINWNGCTAEDEVQIEFLPLPLVNLGDDITQCAGTGINLTTTNYEGASYSWSTGQITQSINISESGIYSVEIDWNGCHAEDEIEIEILPLPVVNLGDEITLCEGTTSSLNAGNEGAACLWSNGQTTQSINITDGGSYSVEVNLNGCTSEDEVQVEFLPLPEFDLGNDIIHCRGIESFLEASHFEGATYTWSTGESEERILITEYGNYWCTAMIGSCAYTDSIAFIQPGYQCFEPFTAIWVPNAFTPDNDGTNDVFGVYGGGISNEHFELNIYNRWGVLIWSTNQPDMKWTGNADNGEHYVPDGVYSYFVKYRFDNMNDDKTLAGHVTLVK